ncbi:MAG: SAM-dependent methyltransferase [Coleofasciculus sp. A1-SPW-01]|uniref:class I SAM-dependent methyltransferase n=1 Tax=Coleofasciculus sp. A1-SPW-01 TaxID=3070819 RepID=UPI003302B2C0
MYKDKPSNTARKVALNIVTLGAKPGMEKILPAGIVNATADLLVASGAVSATAVQWSRSRRMVWVYEAFDWMMKGQFEAFGQRKAFCERQVREGICSGASQVLVLGAGYDTLGWRLASEFTEVNFFEIDHPGTAVLKAKGIERMGDRDNLYLLAEDLGQRKLVDVLKTNSLWDTTASTVIIAEGLLMYLSPPAPQELFRQCAAMTGVGSRIAFTYVGTGADGQPDAGAWTGLVVWILKVYGEPWLWSILPEQLGGFLEEVQWTNAPDLVGSSAKHGIEYFGVAIR